MTRRAVDASPDMVSDQAVAAYGVLGHCPSSGGIIMRGKQRG